MKKVLNSFTFYIVLSIICTIYVIIRVYVIKYKSIYLNKNYDVIGKVIKVNKKSDYTSFTLKSKEKIIVNYNGSLDIFVGDKVKVNIDVTDSKNNTVFNNFNYKKYLYNNKIYKISTLNKIEILSKNKNIFNKLKSFIEKKVSFNKYLKLFILGDKSGISDSYDYYKDIGVAHLLAISGMHVSVFTKIIRRLLFFLKEKTQDKIISIILIFYSFLTGFTASIVRVTVFFIINSLNKWFDLKINVINLLLICLFLLLFINPFFIKNVGFLYSFACSFAINFTSKYANKNYVKNLLITTFYLSLFTFPITINLNYEINLMVFLANLILIPFVSYILFTFALITLIFNFLSPVFSFLTFIMEKISYFLSTFSFTKIIVPKIGILILIIYYTILFLYVYYHKKRYFIMLIFILIMVKNISFFKSEEKIVFLDVSQGDSLIYIPKGQKNVTMIDTGGLRNKNISENALIYLKSIGISKIENLILTHGDYDHMGDAKYIINNFKVKNVYFNCGKENTLEKNLIKILDKKKISYNICAKKVNVNNNYIYFLNNNVYDNENDSSSVLYLKINEYKFLFMGDASIKSENDILKKYSLKNIDILKVGHHGSKTSSGENFINTIKPKYAIISVGKYNRYNHPNESVLNILNKSKIYRTDYDGSVMFKIKNNNLTIKTCNP